MVVKSLAVQGRRTLPGKHFAIHCNKSWVGVNVAQVSVHKEFESSPITHNPPDDRVRTSHCQFIQDDTQPSSRPNAVAVSTMSPPDVTSLLLTKPLTPPTPFPGHPRGTTSSSLFSKYRFQTSAQHMRYLHFQSPLLRNSEESKKVSTCEFLPAAGMESYGISPETFRILVIMLNPAMSLH